MLEYIDFIKNKTLKPIKSGFEASNLNPVLFDYQRDLTKWALRLGKAAIFADTGLGKTFMQLEWAKKVHEKTNKPVLILAPLAVVYQTIDEAKKINIQMDYCKSQEYISNRINITNYERLENFDCGSFSGVVLDESSILKSFDGKYKKLILEQFKRTPYKLACSATPAPNDFMELGNHAEFLDKMTQCEMLAMFFINDQKIDIGSKWRLKGHCEDRFWQWVSSWGAIVKNPSDLGYDGKKHKLPKLNIKHLVVEGLQETSFFPVQAKTLEERRSARKNSLAERCQMACDLVTSKPDEQWLVWCDLNDEADLLKQFIPDSVNVQGSDKPETKAKNLLNFGKGCIKYLITKPKIASFGLNWQSCHNMVFVGISDSYEAFYQAVRRCYRFGQSKPVNVYIITSDKEQNVMSNIKRKQQDFEKMQSFMVGFTKKYVKDNIAVEFKELDKSYKPTVKISIPDWLEEAI